MSFGINETPKGVRRVLNATVIPRSRTYLVSHG